MTLTKVLRDAGQSETTHGFRSSFPDWAAEQSNMAGEIAEAALAHAIPNKVEAAYRRTNYLEKPRELMGRWGRFCARDAAVVRLVSNVRFRPIADIRPTAAKRP